LLGLDVGAAVEPSLARDLKGFNEIGEWNKPPADGPTSRKLAMLLIFERVEIFVNAEDPNKEHYRSCNVDRRLEKTGRCLNEQPGGISLVTDPYHSGRIDDLADAHAKSDRFAYTHQSQADHDDDRKGVRRTKASG